MSNSSDNISLRQAAIVTGAAILLMTIAAIIATDSTIDSLLVKNDAEATTNNIRTSEMLFRFGVFSWLIILICDVLAAWGLYVYLKPVNRSLSLITAWFRLVYAAILGAAILHLINVLVLISGAESYLASFGIAQLQSQVLLSVNGFYQVWNLGLTIFGIHILFLSYLIIRSGYIPKYWGILLFIAGIGYLITTLDDILIPGYENIKQIINYIFILPMLAEVGLGIWLIVKGVKVAEKTMQ